MANTAGPEMKSEFLGKVSELPAMSSAMEYGSAVYNQVKGLNRFTSAALTVAESTALYLAVTAKPFLEKVQPQAKVIDQLACKGLVAVEEKVPFLSMPPEQLVEEARKITSSTLDFANQKVDDIKTYGTETLNNVKSYGVETASKVLNQTENLVDAYLPPAFGEGSPEAPTQSSSMYDRASKLTSKIGLRLYGHGVERVMVVHRVSEEYASKLSYILELVNQLKQNVSNKSVQEVVDEAKLKATWVWDELNKEPSASEEAEKSLEQRALSLARRTTSVLVHVYTTSTLPLASLPSTSQEGVQTAQRYATELFTQLDQATNAGEITIGLLQAVRQKVASLEEVIQSLKSQEIEMEEMNQENVAKGHEAEVDGTS